MVFLLPDDTEALSVEGDGETRQEVKGCFQTPALQAARPTWWCKVASSFPWHLLQAVFWQRPVVRRLPCTVSREQISGKFYQHSPINDGSAIK